MISLSWDLLQYPIYDWPQLAKGYSLGLYYDNEAWQQIGDFLLNEDYTEQEVVWVLTSKHMRWATSEYGPTGNRNPNVTDHEVDHGVEGNFMSLNDFVGYYQRYKEMIHSDANNQS